jgi:cyclopropane-fatty-acyl-phospholipid synthase
MAQETETPDWLATAYSDKPEDVRRGIQHHYDLPPEFFRLFLDRETMSYTCAYFSDGRDTIEAAQRRKLELVARKLELKPGDRVLDIGLGWGNMALLAAEMGCTVTGITLAENQAKYVLDEASRRGFGDRVQVLVEEARSLPFADASFDKVVTIGATEQIADIRTLFQHVARVMTDDGLCLQHSITRSTEPVLPSPELEFMVRHIFPTGALKTLGEYVDAFEDADLEVLDVHDMSDHYPLTLERWLYRLEEAGEQAVTAIGVPVDRYRAQRLFLAGCIVAFAEGHCFLYQELVRKRLSGRYRRPLPAGRERLELPVGQPAAFLPQPWLENPLVAVDVDDRPMLWMELANPVPVPGEPPRQPDCRIKLGSALMTRLAAGESDLATAYMEGEVEAEGNLVAALQMTSTLLAMMGTQ